jgi:hypothetical protein
MYPQVIRGPKAALLVALSLSVVTHADAQESPSADAPQDRGQNATNENQPTLLAQQHEGNAPRPQGNFGQNSVVTGGITPPGAELNPPAQGPAPEPVAPVAEEIAVPPETPATSTDIEAVQSDISGVRTDLENFKFQWQRERDIHTAVTTRFLRVGGVVQARFGWQDEEVNNALVYKRKTSFDVPTAQLTFNGSLYKDYEEGRNLNYSLRFGVSQQANTSNSFLNLLDANISYDALPTVDPESNRLSVTVGQQLLPFGLEVPATEELKPVIRNAQFSANGTGLSLVRREVGLIVRGELFPQVDYGYNYRVALLSWAVGVINGNGPNFLDDNNFKDVVGRLAFTVPSSFNSFLRQITIGGSVVWGKGNTFIPAKTATATTPAAAPILLGKDTRARYGADLYYNHWPIGLTYEFVSGEDPVAAGATKDDAVRSEVWSQSHTATLFYSVGEQFVGAFRNQGRFDDWWPKTYQPFLRYDRYTANKDKPDVYSEIYTGGFNVFFAETTKFQVNYNLRNPSAPGDKWNPHHEVLGQAQFGF